MVGKQHIPIRMCIVCKERSSQSLLNRFCVSNSSISKKITGRSFYICNQCLNKFDEKKIKKALFKYNSLKNCDTKKLKEIFING